MPQSPSTDLPANAATSAIADGPEEQLRANVYSLLAHLLAAPPDDTSLELLQQINGQGDGEDTMLGASWSMLRQAALRADPNELKDEYHDLFLGMGRGELVPYGSWYLTGFLMEQPLAQLRGDLKRLGFERQDGVTEPEDHAAALCDVMSMIITGEAAASLETQADFFHHHIYSWMERFFRDMQQASSARFYRAVGQLGEQFLQVESEQLRFWAPTAPPTPKDRQN